MNSSRSWSESLRVRWTRRARRDLQGIADWVEIGSPTEARRIVRDIRSRAQRLAQFPHLGRGGRLPGTRELVVAPWILTYVIRADDVLVASVRHGSAAWPARRDWLEDL